MSEAPILLADCRAEVKCMAILMELKLRENDGKAHWDSLSTQTLLSKLKAEIRELTAELAAKSISEEAVRREAADVANYAMMIADNAGGLSEVGAKHHVILRKDV